MFGFVTLLADNPTDSALMTAVTEALNESETTTTVTEAVTEHASKVSDFLSQYGIHSYQDVINPTVWSAQSIEGLIVLILLVFVVYKLFHKAYKFAWWCIGAIFFIEILYILGLTEINNTIPLHSIVPFSILGSLSQITVGLPKLSYALYYIDTMLTYSVAKAGVFAWHVLVWLYNLIKNSLPPIDNPTYLSNHIRM